MSSIRTAPGPATTAAATPDARPSFFPAFFRGGPEWNARPSLPVRVARGVRFLAAFPALPAEKLRQQRVEMMHSVFALDGITPAVVGGRAQAVLHVFAEHDILLLHLVAESYGFGHARLGFRLLGVVKKPLKNGQGLLGGERHDHVGRNIVGIDVQHQVGKNPEIEGLAQTASRSVVTLGPVARLHGTDWRELL